MKITKYVHSCLLLETDDRTAIVDPGVFSYKSGALDISSLTKLDRILITHAHPDHCFPPFVAELIAAFPDAHIVAPPSVQKVLTEAGIEATMRDSTQCSVGFESSHESVEALAGAGATPEQSGFHFKDKITLPGDAHNFAESKEILAMPFIAPWGSVMEGIDAVIRLKPKHVIPIHDWQYSQDGQDWLYPLVANRLEQEGIQLHQLGAAESVTL